MRASATSQSKSRKQTRLRLASARQTRLRVATARQTRLRLASARQGAESRNLRAESVDSLRARGVLVVTKAQMAAALQVTYRTITEMMRREEIPFFRVGGKHVRIRVEEALARMEAGGKAEILKAESGGGTTDGHGWTRIPAR